MRHRVCAVIGVALGLAGGAQAQDLVFDMRHTLACLQEAVGTDQQRRCVGASANACMGANSAGGSTVGMGGCLDFELGYWDDRLNASYKALRARERASDTSAALAAK